MNFRMWHFREGFIFNILKTMILSAVSDTKCGIERNNFFVVLKAKVFRGELNCIGRLVSVHIDL